jgi:nitrogen-specific signal transduction histidine kinase
MTHVEGTSCVSAEAALAAMPEWDKMEVEDAQAILENCSLAVHFVDSEGTIIYANKAELECLGTSCWGSSSPPLRSSPPSADLRLTRACAGYTSEEYLGRNITEFHASKDTIGDIFARLKRRETLLNYEVRISHEISKLRPKSRNGIEKSRN